MRPTPQEIAADCSIIDALGGPAAVARELKLKPESGVQTVQNWKTRGIPPRVKLQRPDLFLRNLLAAQASERPQARSREQKARA